jgi:protein-disulfide isomerase
MSPVKYLRPCLAAAALGIGVMLGLAAGPARAEMTATQRTEVEGVVKDYLMQHPELLKEALTELDRREKAQEEATRVAAVTNQKAMIFDSPHQAVLGNPNGKVTLVEFFDYNCGYCKKALDDVGRLIKEEPDLRVVLKDFPILTPGSVEASHVAIALRNQFKGDKYWQFHSRLLATRGPVAKAQAMSLAKDMGADMIQLARDVEAPEVRASLEEVAHLADTLSLTGTPSFVLGQDVIVGAVGYDDLKARLGNVRKCGKVACG